MSMGWRRVTQTSPPFGSVAYLYRAGDLYPVTGWRDGRASWILEEGGPEDGGHRMCPRPGGGEEWQPTHYAEIDHGELCELAREGSEG